MDCKKALTETNGDMDAAVDVLRKSGAAKMEKKQAELPLKVSKTRCCKRKRCCCREVNSETDFVANNEDIPGVCSDSCRYSTCFCLNGGAILAEKIMEKLFLNYNCFNS